MSGGNKRGGGKAKNAGLGRALQRNKYGHVGENDELAGMFTTDLVEPKGNSLRSHTSDKTDLEELLEVAELDERNFVAEKQNVVVITSTAMKVQHDYDVEKQRQLQWNILTVPKRPAWTKKTTAEELHQMEKESFLEWRRNLAEVEEKEKFMVTPFEKNIEVWRQLWRVVERSDLIVQILDARNPLLFRSPSLEVYVKELNEKKINMVVINKSDLLSKRQRAAWAEYFKSQGLKCAFFSAYIEQVKLENPDLVLKSDDSEATHIYSKDELVKLFTDLCPEPIGDPTFTEGKITVGLVGYPNVGKSSTINVLFGEKKVAVAATPGKTKHFQTLTLSDKIILCDCPGLVFPTVVGTAAEMVCSGLLPIHQMRDFISPVDLVCQRIPRHVLEDTYGVVLPPPPEGQPEDSPPTADELLNSYAFARGFMTASGLPDQSRAARIVLTDYVAGKLIYCHPPHGTDAKAFQVKRPRKEQPKTEKKPTYLANKTRSAGDEGYYDYLTQQDKVKAKTTVGSKNKKFSQEAQSGFTRGRQTYYTPIPVAQLKKDQRAIQLLYGDVMNKE